MAKEVELFNNLEVKRTNRGTDITFDEYLNEDNGTFIELLAEPSDYDYIAHLYNYKGDSYYIAWDNADNFKTILRTKIVDDMPQEMLDYIDDISAEIIDEIMAYLSDHELFNADGEQFRSDFWEQYIQE